MEWYRGWEIYNSRRPKEADWREDILRQSAVIAQAEKDKVGGPKAVRPKGYMADKKKRRKTTRVSRAKNRTKKRRKKRRKR